jgi:hypothetical protein
MVHVFCWGVGGRLFSILLGFNAQRDGAATVAEFTAL